MLSSEDVETWYGLSPIVSVEAGPSRKHCTPPTDQIDHDLDHDSFISSISRVRKTMVGVRCE